jgi:hypothetical protein
MCSAECDYATLSFPAESVPRQLKLNDPLYYSVDPQGVISVNGAIHTVLNGTLPILTGANTRLDIEFRLVLPLSVGCSQISMTSPAPVLTIYLNNETTGRVIPPFTISGSPAGINGNTITYRVTSFDPGNTDIQYCITHLSLDGQWGKIAFGCGCDKPEGCQKLASSLELIRATSKQF